MKKRVESRLENLESGRALPDDPEIIVDWSENPDHSDLKPGDVVVTWGPDDIVKRQVVREKKH
jgi:cell shape-determining protein MreC